MDNNPNPTPTPQQPPAPVQPEQPQPIQQVAPQPVAAAPAAPVAKKGLSKKSKALIIVFSAVALLFAGVFALFGLVGNLTGPAAVVTDKFVNAVQANDPDAAYELTAQAFRDATPKADLAAIINGVSSSLTGDEQQTGSAFSTINGTDQVVVVYSVKNNGSTNYIRVVTQKVGEEWQVMSFKSSSTQLDLEI